MNTEANIFKNPLSVGAKDYMYLKECVNKYPYFQPGHLLLLKSLQQADSPDFQKELPKTALYCADRKILYRYLQHPHVEATTPIETPKDTSTNAENFTEEKEPPKVEVQEEQLDKAEPNFEEETEIVYVSPEENEALNLMKLGLDHMVSPEMKIRLSELNISKFAQTKIKPEEQNKSTGSVTEEIQKDDEATNKLEIQVSKDENSKPKEHSEHALHSFTDWLKVNSNTDEKSDSEIPIEENYKEENENASEDENDRFKIIDEFLKKNPKISPSAEYKSQTNYSTSNERSMSHLMTETLAQIYEEQKKYDKAIKAYTILRLKYPEKSGFFADQIRRIKNIQNK